MRSKILLIFSCFLFFQQNKMSAQTSIGNPFDLTFRLPDSALVADAASNGNPFDIVSHRLPQKLAPKKEKATWIVPRVDVPRGKSRNPTFLFASILLAMGYLTVMVTLFRPTISKSIKSFRNDNFLNLTFREVGQIMASPFGMFYIHFVLQMGIFCFLLTRWFLGDTFNNFGYLILCTIAVSSIYALRHLLISFVGFVFPVEKEVAKYHFTITIFNLLLGLFLFPLNLLIAWGPPELARSLLYFSLGLIALFYFLQCIRGLGIGAKFLSSAQLHFLAYLCVVEIAPILVLVKLVFLQTGVR
jgi:Domain of unknown function (DUF4271)